jgi:hypothetical protein
MLQTGLIFRFGPFRAFSPVRARARAGVHERSVKGLTAIYSLLQAAG